MEAGIRTSLMNALDLLLDVICLVDGEGRFVAVSAACEQVFGYTQQEMIGMQFLDLVLAEDREKTMKAAATVMGGNPLRNFENRYVRKDGQVIDIMWSAIWSETDRLRLAVAREVTVRKHAEAMQAVLYEISEAAHSAEDLTDLFRRIQQIIGDMLPTRNFSVALYDERTDELSFPYSVDEHSASSAQCRLDSGGMTAEVIRSGAALLLTPDPDSTHGHEVKADDVPEVIDWLGVPLIADGRTIGALVVKSYASTVRYNEQHKTLLQFVSTQIAANIEHKRANARIQYMAQYDVLTGLPNRALFDDRLHVALARAARDKEPMALLYIDLDNFKPVNDRYGHAAGDLLLQEVARRVQACVRKSDTVSRTGGDEFVVLLGALKEPMNAKAVAEKIRAELNLPVVLAGEFVQVSSSIGVAIHPVHGTDPNQLMRNADTAMYAAKNSGGNRCVVFAG